MSRFKRFCYFIFFIASVLGVGVLAVDWFGFEPLAGYVEGWMGQQWFYYALIVCLAILALGLLIVFFSAIFTRGTRLSQETVNDFGSIFISRTALERTVEKTIDLHADLSCKDARVRIRKGSKDGSKPPTADIYAEVMPHGISTLGDFGQNLQQEVKGALEKLTGNPVSRVRIEFLEEPPAKEDAEKEA